MDARCLTWEGMYGILRRLSTMELFFLFPRGDDSVMFTVLGLVLCVLVSYVIDVKSNSKNKDGKDILDWD